MSSEAIRGWERLRPISPTSAAWLHAVARKLRKSCDSWAEAWRESGRMGQSSREAKDDAVARMGRSCFRP